MRNNALVYLVAMLALGLSCVAKAISNDFSAAAISARTKPVGEVKAAEPTAEKATVGAGEPAQAAITGEAIYNKHCTVCHSSGIAGAPKIGDGATWAPRMKKGLDGMLQQAIKGINAMPPKGTCVTCTDAQLKQAIQYMLPKKT